MAWKAINLIALDPNLTCESVFPAGASLSGQLLREGSAVDRNDDRALQEHRPQPHGMLGLLPEALGWSVSGTVSVYLCWFAVSWIEQ